MINDIEVIYIKRKWHVREQISHKVIGSYRLKKTAVEVGRVAARILSRDGSVELFVKRRDGQISWRNTYGHDPRDIPG